MIGSNQLSYRLMSAMPRVVYAFSFCLAVLTLESLHAQTLNPARVGPESSQADPTESDEAAGIQDKPSSSTDTADGESKQPTVDRVSRQELEDFAAKLAGTDEVDAETKASIEGLVEQATGELDRADKLEKSAAADRMLAESAPARLEAFRQSIEELDTDILKPLPSGATPDQLESRLVRQRAALQEAKSRRQALENEASRRTERRKQILQLQASYPSRITAAEETLRSSARPEDSVWKNTAREFQQRAKLQALRFEQPALQWELAKYDAEAAVDFTSTQSRVAAEVVQDLEAQVDDLMKKVEFARRKVARTRVDELSDFAQSLKDPLLRELADRNADLAKKNELVVQDVVKVSQDLEAARTQLEELVAAEKKTRQRVERVGLSGATGLELRKQLSSLPDTRALQSQGWQRQERMRFIESERLNYEDALAEIQSDLQPASDSEGNSRIVAQQIENDYASTLESLTKNYDRYFQSLSDLDFSEKQLISESNTFREFLTEQVLWIRSGPFFSSEALSEANRTIKSLLRPAIWLSAVAALFDDATGQPWLYAMGLVALALLMAVRYRGRHQLVRLGTKAKRTICTDYVLTVRTLLLTIMIACAWPMVMAFVGWRLAGLSVDSDQTIAIGNALIAAAVVLALLNLIRQGSRYLGLAEAHFGWPSHVTETLRRKTRAITLLGVPAVFLITMLSGISRIGETDGLYRLSLSIGLLLLSSFLYGVLHPKKGAIADFLVRHNEAWYSKTATLWFWVLVLLPISVAILTMIGFSYSAQQLSLRLVHSVWVVVLIVVVRAMVIRSLQVSHRRVRIAAAKERMAEMDSSTESTSDFATPEDDAEAFRTSGEQVLRILHSTLWVAAALSLWLLWSPIVPALGILNQYELWQTVREVSVTQTMPDGEIKKGTETVLTSVTPVHILRAILLSLITFTLVRNAPGLIEITVLKRLPIDASFKFAIAMMCRYVILVVGSLLVFASVGFDWSKLQWLVAALTVGLGFGLQEIFGNFVSGLIILWERPIRIGDVVTLDGISGKVSRIQMRATTISDWDRKDYIVPNKDFVTGRLLNWTRSDQLSRVVIEVGVAYGSDVPKAIELLKNVAIDHPAVLDDPEPSVTFDNFGSSTLNLILRCFLPSLDGRLDTISELNLRINEVYADAEIEIAFPQQDIHIRSMPEIGETSVVGGE